ncbi:heme-binding protein 2-like [Amphibalanus amphitrite]|uniref:heme-binding protein 2-like n=1 Tax=Amphibalanus amphitrite TaxID=1232801 RepID=UPI001C902704|nr:heme-binding protein 2-like [Amphibalanus amphitrite]
MKISGVAVLALCVTAASCLPQDGGVPAPAAEASPPGGGGPAPSVTAILDQLGSWFSGVSGKLYTAVSDNLRNRVNLDRVTDQVSTLIPRFDYAPFTVISNNSEAGYEVRHYPAQLWACTEEPVTVEPMEEEAVQWNRTKLMFDRLFKYFAGENSRDEKIQMTLPQTTRFDAYSESPTYRLCWYLPHALQNSPPPTPDDSYVEVALLPARTVIARRFGGYVVYRRGWDRAAFALEKITREHGLQNIDFTKYYSVNYDPLLKFWNRKNEVWFELQAN